MTKQEAQELMTYLEEGWSIPDCKLYLEGKGPGELETFWDPGGLTLRWGSGKGLFLGYILENPENYSWKKIRGGWEFEWNGKGGKWDHEPKSERFFWRKPCDFNIDKN